MVYRDRTFCSDKSCSDLSCLRNQNREDFKPRKGDVVCESKIWWCEKFREEVK